MIISGLFCKPNITSATLLAFLIILPLSSCQQTGGPAEALSLKTKAGASQTITKMAKIAQTCWFKSKDKAFAKYKLAAEVNSYAGRPRFLLVPKHNPGGLPLLVVQAESKGTQSSGKYSAVDIFGPILSTSSGKRIASDIERWSSGNTSCKA